MGFGADDIRLWGFPDALRCGWCRCQCFGGRRRSWDVSMPRLAMFGREYDEYVASRHIFTVVETIVGSRATDHIKVLS
jgi:hypothetical protein